MASRKPPAAAPPLRARAIVERKDGTQMRRTTVYFPADLARLLKVHCAEHGYDMSSVVSEAVRRYLAG